MKCEKSNEQRDNILLYGTAECKELLKYSEIMERKRSERFVRMGEDESEWQSKRDFRTLHADISIDFWV